MPTEIPAKLRATMAALGCQSRKDLAARFRAQNPRTICEIDSLHKWMQGRATPRFVSFYQEWVTLLGLSQSGDWARVCSLDAFVTELAATTGVTIERLRHEGSPPTGRPTATPPTHGLIGGLFSLQGLYLCYSRAMSPRYPDHLIRGTLLLEDRRDGTLGATYRERLVEGPVAMPGQASISGRTLNVEVTEPGSGVRVLLILHVPGPPVTAMCGVIAAPALIASEPLPTATTFLAVRAPDGTAPEAGNRYLRLDPGAVAIDLAEAGVMLRTPGSFDEQAIALLSQPPHRVPRSMQTDFEDALYMPQPEQLLSVSQAVGDG